MTNEMEMRLAHHAEERGRCDLVIEEAESFIWLMKRASAEWQRALGYLRREYSSLADRVAEDRRRAAADFEVEDMRRQKEARESASALRREVESLSALRDSLRDEVAQMSQQQQHMASARGGGGNGGAYSEASLSRGGYLSSSAAASYSAPGLGLGAADSAMSSSTMYNTHGAAANQSALNLGSPIPNASPYGNTSYAAGGGSAGASSSSAAPPPTTSSLGVLRSVRDQLREIRENNNVSPVRGSTPQRASSPSAQQWKERLSKLQGDLRTLRTELGATPQRPAGGY